MGDEIFERLLEDTDFKDKYGNTLLHFAVKHGQIDVIRELLLSGEDINTQNKKGETPLHWAAGCAIKSGHMSIIRALLRLRKPKIYSISKGGRASLYVAGYGKIDVVKVLLEMGADPLSRDRKNRIPRDFTDNNKIKQLLQYAEIYHAAKNGQIDQLKALLAKNIDVNANNDKYRHTPLHYAAEWGQIEVVKYLIEQGADVNAKSKYRSTPLHYAAEWGQIEVVKYLIEQGADVNIQNKLKETPLHLAAQKDHIKVVEYLLTQGAGVNARSREEITPLHYAAEKGRTEVVRYLLEKGADIDVQNGYGETPLHLAAQYKNIEVVKTLLALGADVNAVAKNGKTALQMATKNRLFSKSIYGKGFVGKVQASTAEYSDVFEKHGSALTTKLPSGIEFQKRSNHQEVIDALLSAGAKSDTQMESIQTTKVGPGLGK
ncbi:Ankyrin repeat-containing domain,Ankyrin repeat [Cinara cedri]|uniref:Ankyrin repeat-containing domain,Ankyrin repeat n=1 Tax=Cinara cedri TaxID=506608 RepID=A0A5E4NGR7_9HEMI|nr:Ankyrin repeat-containing domain,Ankyrin repeat [Cinara cedri]